MHQHFDISPEETKRAKWPHEIFLINLIVNHVFVFLATVSVVKTFPLMPLLIPTISCCIIGYILVKSRQVAASNEIWFVKSHWQICARRNRFFLILLSVPCAVTAIGLSLAKMLGWSKIPTIALIGGVGLLPFMVSLLVLIVLGNESVHMARSGNLPKRFVELNPNPQAESAQ